MAKRLLIVLLLFMGAAMAVGVYKWVDEHGQTVYSDQPPPGKAARQVEAPEPPTPEAADRDQQELQTLREKRARQEAQEVLGTLSLSFMTVIGASDFPQPPFMLTAVIRSLERGMDSKLEVKDPSPEWNRDADIAVSSHQDFSFFLRPGSYELVAIEVEAPSLSASLISLPVAARHFVVPEGNCVYIGRIYFLFFRLPPLPFDQSAELATRIIEKADRQAFVFHYLPRGALIPWESGVDSPATAGPREEVKGGQRALARARERGCAIRLAGS